MKVFISYSHHDEKSLEFLHKHLTQLQRDGVISTWTDRDIMPGEKVNQNISSALKNADLFIALLSPDYIASNYCYNEEFKSALAMQEEGLIIIPVIVEPCDWLSTPFKDFKALPADGKAISVWGNKNTAFLDVIQNIRKLVTQSNTSKNVTSQAGTAKPIPRNYRIQKDFDSIEKMEFVEKSLHEIKEYLKKYIEEILTIDNIKARILIDNNNEFECILVNRNKIATESHLKISIASESSSLFNRGREKQISYAINSAADSRQSSKILSLSFDEYHLFWLQSDYFSVSQNRKELELKDIANLIWDEWLANVGIL